MADLNQESVGEGSEKYMYPQDTIPHDAPKPNIGPNDVSKVPSFSDWLGSPEALAMASGLLQASGPHPYPISFGQALGAGTDAMLKAKLQFGNQDLEKSKFGYQQKHDTDLLNLEKTKVGYEGRKVTNEEKMTQLHGALFGAETDKIKAALENQKQMAQMLGLGVPPSPAPINPMTAAPTPIATPPSGPLLTPNEPSTPPAGLLNSASSLAQPTNVPNAGLLNSPPPPAPISQGSPPLPPPSIIPPTGIPAQSGTPSILASLTPQQQQGAKLAILSGHPEKVGEFIMGKSPEPFSLPEGSVRYDAQGNIVAKGNPKNELTPREKETIAEGLAYGSPEFQARMVEKANRDNITHQVSTPVGYAPNDPANPQGGLHAIPGGPAEGEKNAVQAGKIALLTTAQKILPSYENLLFNKNPDGTINYNSPNKVNIFNGNVPLPYFNGSMPTTQGREMRDQVEQIVQASSRAAQNKMSSDDIAHEVDRLLPKFGDNTQTIIDKHQNLKDMIQNSLNAVDPHGLKGFNKDVASSATPLSTNANAAVKAPTAVNANVKSMNDKDLLKFLGVG